MALFESSQSIATMAQARPMARGLGRQSADLRKLQDHVEEFLIAVPGQVSSHLLKGQPHQHVHLVIGLELADVGGHEVVGHDFRLAFAVRVVCRADESHYATLQADLFEHFAHRSLFERLTGLELALGERPVAPRFSVDAGDFDSAARHESSHYSPGGADEIVGGVSGDNEFSAQEVHIANGR